MENQVAAVKVKKNIRDIDFSLSYAYHFKELPALFLNLPNPSLPAYELFQRYPRQHTLGSDFETVMGKTGLRGEFAYTLKDQFLTSAPTRPDTVVDKGVLRYIFGGDYTFPNNAYINLQYYAQYIPRHETGMASRKYEDGVMLKASKKYLHDTLMFDVLSRINLFNPSDYYYQAECIYDLTDKIKLTFGYNAFAGEADSSYFGQYNSNDQFYTNLRYSF